MSQSLSILFFLLFVSNLSTQSDPSIISLNAKAVTEIGADDGSFGFTLTNGEKPFEYTWDQLDGELNGNGIVNLVNRELRIKELPEGRYQLTVVDNQGTLIFDGDVAISGPIADAVAVPEVENIDAPNADPPRYNILRPPPEAYLDEPISTPEPIEVPAAKATESLMYQETIYFKADSTSLDLKAKIKLNQLLSIVKNQNITRIEIDGHTNGVQGIKDDFCNRLGQNRANTVKQWLVSKGLVSNSITAKTYGKREPQASNTSKSGRKRNQRVVLKVYGI